MLNLERGRYRARFAIGEADLLAAQALRWRAFFPEAGAPPQGAVDSDAFDARCHHVLIEEGGTLVCCFRLLPLAGGSEISSSYSAQFYDLTALQAYDGAFLEMGRFCLAPGRHDPDILRLAWGAVTRLVDEGGVRLLFGCSSFHGISAEPHLTAFAELRRRHLAPAPWAPRRRAPEVVALPVGETPDPLAAARSMPPLLRSYLAMGGWVSDHAVVDREMNTLHVFTGLEIDKVPPARARLLRAVAG